LPLFSGSCDVGRRRQPTLLGPRFITARLFLFGRFLRLLHTLKLKPYRKVIGELWRPNHIVPDMQVAELRDPDGDSEVQTPADLADAGANIGVIIRRL
jgi:hypothetical protein